MRFFLVDRVDELIPGERIKGVKNVSLSEEIFNEHFPDYPIFPGTLVVEALAQLGGCLVEATVNQDKDNARRAILGQIEKAKFPVPAQPGDRLVLTCRLLSPWEGAARLACVEPVYG